MSQPAINARAFAEVKELMGDDFKEVITLFIASLPKQLNILEKAIENNDVKQLYMVSHKMEGSSGSIGALGLAEKAHTIEMVGREGSTDVTDQALNELKDAINQVITTINAELSS